MSLKSKMGILYLCQYFKTLNQPEGTRSYYFAKGLVEKGHNVIVKTLTGNIHANIFDKNTFVDIIKSKKGNIFVKPKNFKPKKIKTRVAIKTLNGDINIIYTNKILETLYQTNVDIYY